MLKRGQFCGRRYPVLHNRGDQRIRRLCLRDALQCVFDHAYLNTMGLLAPVALRWVDVAHIRIRFRRNEVEPVSRSPEQSEGKRVRRTVRKGRLEVRIKDKQRVCEVRTPAGNGDCGRGSGQRLLLFDGP